VTERSEKKAPRERLRRTEGEPANDASAEETKKGGRKNSV